MVGRGRGQAGRAWQALVGCRVARAGGRRRPTGEVRVAWAGWAGRSGRARGGPERWAEAGQRGEAARAAGPGGRAPWAAS